MEEFNIGHLGILLNTHEVGYNKTIQVLEKEGNRMSRILLNPKVNFVFKKIFASEKHPQVLISLLNAIIKPKSPIETVEIKNSDIKKDFLEDKFSRLDIKAKTGQGERINVEIQLKNEYNMIKRSLYYWSKMYEEQLVEGEDYDKLQRTICINILDFRYLKMRSSIVVIA